MNKTGDNMYYHIVIIFPRLSVHNKSHILPRKLKYWQLQVLLLFAAGITVINN